MNRTRVALFNDRSAAEPVLRRLLQVGIPAGIHNEPWLVRLWFVSKADAGFCVEVPDCISELAENLLLAWDDGQGVLRSAIHCPECGSLRVDYPQFTRKSIFANLAAGILAGLGLVERDYYCERCHCLWPKLRARPRRPREHRAQKCFIESFSQTEFPVTVARTMDKPAVPVGVCRAEPPGRTTSLPANMARAHVRKPCRRTQGRRVHIR